MSQSPRPEAEGEQTERTSEENDTQIKDMDRLDEYEQGLGHDFEVKEQDRWLPIANVARIMKGALPDNAKIAKEAKECMQECVSEFISFITSEASEKCQQEKRKTVNGEDIIFAMTSLGFENYSEALKIYLSRYRETLVARGEAKPVTAGGSGAPAAGSSEYEGGNAAMIGGTLDSNEEHPEYGYNVGQTSSAEYQ